MNSQSSLALDHLGFLMYVKEKEFKFTHLQIIIMWKQQEMLLTKDYVISQTTDKSSQTKFSLMLVLWCFSKVIMNLSVQNYELSTTQFFINFFNLY